MVHEGSHNCKQPLQPVKTEKIIPQNFYQEKENVLSADEYDEEVLIRSEHNRAAQAAGDIVKG